MTAPTAADALSRLDDGTATPTDRAIADIFDRHCSDYWHRVDTQVDRWQADVCVICGNPGGPECVRCAIDHDTDMTRRADR